MAKSKVWKPGVKSKGDWTCRYDKGERRLGPEDFHQIVGPDRGIPGSALKRIVTRLEILRRKQGITQKGLAQKLGIDQAMISLVERGGTWRMDYLVRAAQVLGWDRDPRQLLDIISPWIQVPQQEWRYADIESGTDKPIVKSRVRLKMWSDEQLSS